MQSMKIIESLSILPCLDNFIHEFLSKKAYSIAKQAFFQYNRQEKKKERKG